MKKLPERGQIFSKGQSSPYKTGNDSNLTIMKSRQLGLLVKVGTCTQVKESLTHSCLVLRHSCHQVKPACPFSLTRAFPGWDAPQHPVQRQPPAGPPGMEQGGT
ncbi:hypothetical protein H1C71_042617 [Ictidomys tridecemlineatus]|nr:hypothetical protein H1C71_042617 [Ictidomys tridecemlineatus]